MAGNKQSSLFSFWISAIRGSTFDG
jgi:hypothetical protein